MIDTSGMLTVEQAAKRLDRSTEQVRRYLREGKLRGQRIGNQWFVDERSLGHTGDDEWLLPRDFVASVLKLRAEINKDRKEPFDVIEMLREDRESH